VAFRRRRDPATVPLRVSEPTGAPL
jgi:hypothetical protein